MGILPDLTDKIDSMYRDLDWRSHVNEKGDFELPSYLYKTINTLMKQALDMGTLLSDDPAKLRAFKEQTKSVFKRQWMEIAQALEFFDIVIPCGCGHSEYCRECGGSRYRLNSAISPDRLREIACFAKDQSIAKKLRWGLKQALMEIGEED